MAPVIRACEKEDIDYQLIHMGQHYSYEMDKIFFQELELPESNYNLDVGFGIPAEQTAKILMEIEKILVNEKYGTNDVVLVESDTNTVFATALVASKLHVKIGHVEAGLRSYDRNMPEEINRILTDHISDYLFVPTENAKKILLSEGIEKEKIFVTGNTIVDSVYQNLELAEKKVDVFEKLEIKKGNYFLVTTHRVENVDVKEKLIEIIERLKKVNDKYKLPIIFPAYPRPIKIIQKFNIKLNENIKLIKPLGFLEFLQLEANVKLVLTDSGGVQEETSILKAPCITVGDNAEKPETIDVVGNVLAGSDPDMLFSKVNIMINKERNWKNPFCDGKSGEKIGGIIKC